MALSDNTTPPRYNLSNLITGSNAIVGEFVLRDIIGPIQYTGPYYTYINSGGKEYYTGKYPNFRNDNGKGKNLSNGTEIKVGSNYRLLEFSEAGITSTSKFEPVLYDISKDINAVHYYNGVIRRFFARRISDDTYRETNYTSFDGITKKDSQWDFNNWEVKEVFDGWKVNYYVSQPSPSSTLNQFLNTVYTSNKNAILAIDKGFTFPPLSKSTTPASSGTPPTNDTNSSTPWPKFKEWYCNQYGGNFRESYYVIKDQNGNYISNPSYMSPGLIPSTSPPTATSVTFYKKDEPSIPLNVRFYSFVQKETILSGIKLINTLSQDNAEKAEDIPDSYPFLYLATPVVRDVRPNSPNSLDTTKSFGLGNPPPGFLEKKIYGEDNLCYISEIFLGDTNKYPHNPNSPLQLHPPNFKDYKGIFCKSVDGKFHAQLVPYNGFNIKLSRGKRGNLEIV